MSVREMSGDNRRLVVRVFCQEVLAMLAQTARDSGDDIIGLLIYTGVWTANTRHLVPPRGMHYVEVQHIPPDRQRIPIPEGELAELLAMPRGILSVYVEEMIEKGVLERLSAGLVVPSAVIAKTESVATLNATHDRLMALLSSLKTAGIRFPNPA